MPRLSRRAVTEGGLNAYARWMGLLPWMYPTPWDIAYFGGIEINMCTWSGIRCPSSIRLSYCLANLWNTSPRYLRSSRHNVRRRHFGMNTGILHGRVLGGSRRGASPMDSRKCQTVAVAPAKPGVSSK